jgi:hypothetical protein
MLPFIRKKDEYTNLVIMGGGEGRPLFATVDITSYSLFNLMKKVERREVVLCSSYWVFVDTGFYTPDYDVENLYRKYKARKEQREMRRNAGFPIPEDMRDMVVPKKVMYECLNDR